MKFYSNPEEMDKRFIQLAEMWGYDFVTDEIELTINMSDEYFNTLHNLMSIDDLKNGIEWAVRKEDYETADNINKILFEKKIKKLKVNDSIIVIERTYNGKVFEWDGVVTQITNAYIETKHCRIKGKYPKDEEEDNWNGLGRSRTYLDTWTKNYGTRNLKLK